MKIIWIRTCSQIFKKFSYGEDLLLFWMMLNIAFGHLQALGNNIYTRNSSPANIYLFKINIRNTKKKCEICSKLTIEAPERLSTVFFVNFRCFLHLFLLFLLLTLNKTQLNASWVLPYQLINAETTNCCNYVLYKNFCEIEAHGRLSSTRDTMRLVSDMIVKIFSILFLKIFLLTT